MPTLSDACVNSENGWHSSLVHAVAYRLVRLRKVRQACPNLEAHRSGKDVHAYTLQVAGAALSALAPMIIKAGRA
jgi:hypothetical protein